MPLRICDAACSAGLLWICDAVCCVGLLVPLRICDAVCCVGLVVPLRLCDAVCCAGLLVPLRMCCDWLRANEEVLRSCTESSAELWRHLVQLVNAVTMEITTDTRGERAGY